MDRDEIDENELEFIELHGVIYRSEVLDTGIESDFILEKDFYRSSEEYYLGYDRAVFNDVDFWMNNNKEYYDWTEEGFSYLVKAIERQHFWNQIKNKAKEV